MRAPAVIGTVIAVVLALWAAVHVLSAEASKNSPPTACQLLGGRWDIWNGWRCG